MARLKQIVEEEDDDDTTLGCAEDPAWLYGCFEARTKYCCWSGLSMWNKQMSEVLLHVWDAHRACCLTLYVFVRKQPNSLCVRKRKFSNMPGEELNRTAQTDNETSLRSFVVLPTSGARV